MKESEILLMKYLRRRAADVRELLFKTKRSPYLAQYTSGVTLNDPGLQAMIIINIERIVLLVPRYTKVLESEIKVAKGEKI